MTWFFSAKAIQSVTSVSSPNVHCSSMSNHLISYPDRQTTHRPWGHLYARQSWCACLETRRRILLLDADYDAETICEVLDIGPTVLMKWKFAFAGMGLSFFGLIDYSQRQGDLLAEQETLLTTHFTDSPARTTDKICACILTQHGKSCCSSGAAKLLKRLGFTYKKLQSMPAQADEAKQKVFIAHHEALRPNWGLTRWLCFGYRPSHKSKPAHLWLAP